MKVSQKTRVVKASKLKASKITLLSSLYEFLINPRASEEWTKN